MTNNSRFRAALLLFAAISRFSSVHAAEDRWDAPQVRVASPDRNAYVIHGSASKRKLLLVVEITDVSGAGIEVDKSGVPRFVDAGHNVDLFAGNIVEKNTYTNHLGQEVIQLVALVPVEGLKTDSTISPPIDFKRIRPSEGERKFPVPPGEMVPCANVWFQVRDLRGVLSDRNTGLVTIGLANGLWVPSATVRLRQPLPVRAAVR
jgi:hypothetical protein